MMKNVTTLVVVALIITSMNMLGAMEIMAASPVEFLMPGGTDNGGGSGGGGGRVVHWIFKLIKALLGH